MGRSEEGAGRVNTQAERDAWAYLAADERRYKGFLQASASVHARIQRERRDAARRRIGLKFLAAAICFAFGLLVGRADSLGFASVFLIATPWVIVGFVAPHPEHGWLEEIFWGIVLGAVVFGIGFAVAH